jgi:CubicO group peptidase (beta-lactamase class C family)
VPKPAIQGHCDPRFTRVRDALVGNFAKHDELGASVAVTIDGRTVVELWAGWCDAARARPWQRNTLVNVFSVGKGVLSLGAMSLVGRGLLDLDAPVCRWWPEFAQGGKEAVTVRQLLAHQAGLPAVREVLPPRAMFDWKRMTGALAKQEPWWTPGTRHGYHVNTLGFLVGELVRRISGKSAGTFLREEFSAPLGADFHIGLAAEHHSRVADFVWLPELDLAPKYDPAKLTDDQLMMFHAYFNPQGSSGNGLVNDAAWRLAEYPSTNGHATALGIAKVFGVIASGGAREGRRYVEADALREAACEQSSGIDAILGKPSRMGLGFQLPGLSNPLLPNEGSVLHFGAGGALGFADPAAGIAFGYALNRMGPRFENPRPRALVRALYECL